MKFNDKEMAMWASTFTPDKEGMLEKKGAERWQGYKQRWFRLKGNLLFYFRVDDYGGWEGTGEPLGVLLLERCQVEEFQHDSRPHCFTLSFEHDDARCYYLSAYSQTDLEGWISAIRMASYEGLRATLYKLQKKLVALTGEDPLKDKGVSQAIEPSPKPKPRFEQSLKRSAYMRSSNKERARRINSLTVAPLFTGPQYELSISCSHLAMAKTGTPPSTLVRTRCYATANDTHPLSTLSPTEVFESSCCPSYALLVLMEIGVACPASGHLTFEVLSVNPSQLAKIESKDISLRCSIDELETMGTCVGKAECPVSSCMGNKEVKLALSDKQIVCGFIHISPLKLEEPASGSPRTVRRNALDPLDRRGPNGVLPNVMSHPVRYHFNFATKGNMKFKVVEEMAECVFNTQVPIELLRCYLKEDNDHLQELYAIGALEDSWLESLQEYQTILFESIGFYGHALRELEGIADTFGFKPSTQKKDDSVQFVPTNLHIQRIKVNGSEKGDMTYSVTTSGCPADHVRGFKSGGLRKLLSECRSSPSFISRWSEGASSSVKSSIARLNEIRQAIYHHKDALYRACANASPQDMNDATIGVSKQVQQLLWQMQSSVVSNAVEGLIMARPGSILGVDGGSEGVGGGGMNLTVPTSPSKRQSMKRRSMAFGGKCNCGKCCRCVPSPSDWLWNGHKFVQVSSREWKLTDSCASIQRSLMVIVDAVETAARKVVDQQHEAVASEVGYTLTTFKPSYVWSAELMPLMTRLTQTLDGLFRVALSSLSFNLVRLDSYVQGLRVLKRRRDIVFSQALTLLVTSFYVMLSQNFMNPLFLKQIREIGFLAQFESLLSSLGDESGMLEDMCVAVAELGSVSFQLAELRDSEIPLDFHIIGTRDSLTVQFLLAREYLIALPDEPLRLGEPITVVPVLFTQGVNEIQTLANFKQQIQLQEDINYQGLNTLSRYVDKYKSLLSTDNSSQAKLEIVQIKDLLDLLKQSYATHKSKNIEFLITVEQLCRRLRGGRLTSCKSGKDRTSMSVTLEECCLLRTNHHLDSDAFMKTLSTLRSHGTRLENCLKNTGHRCYNFNQLQLMMLPKLLAPPLYTCRDE